MKIKDTLPKLDRIALILDSLAHAISYDAYRKLVSDHVAKGTSTGPVQTPALSQYTLLNDSRMRRLDKTTLIPEYILDAFKNFKGDQTWLVISESWCGDAAQSLPMMNKLAEIAASINLKIVLRDEHPALMSQFLTNGTMGIPKLIVFDNQTQEIIGDWGPRPSTATQMVIDYKQKHGTLTPEFKHELQVWYNKDKGKNIAEDLYKLIF